MAGLGVRRARPGCFRDRTFVERMERPGQIIVFTLDDRLYGLRLSAVERVVRMVDVTPLPQAPDIVLGVIDVQGRIVPVVNLRRRFRLPERPASVHDQIILAHTARRPVALVADAVHGVREHTAPVKAAADILPGIEHVEGIVKLDDGLILIHNLDRFLSLDEERSLDRALSGGEA